jgi:hypothetical protein
MTYLSVCTYMHGRETGRVGVRACNDFSYPVYNAYAPYCDVSCGPSDATIFFDIIS